MNTPQPTAVVQISTSSEIQHATDQFQIAQGYFSSVIGVQTAIFSIIVAAILALYFVFNWRASKDYIKKEVDIHSKNIKEESDKEFAEKMEKLENIFSVGMARHEKEIGRLSGFNYRALGQVWQNSERYDNAFIWWFRASAEFAKIEDDKLTRFCLSKAKNCLDRIESGSDLSTGVIGDYQKLLADLPDAYKIEKDLVDASIKQVLAKKP